MTADHHDQGPDGDRQRLGVHGSHGPVDTSSGDPVTPGQAQVGEAGREHAAGENDTASEASYYRATQKTGARLALGTIAVPVVLIVIVAIAMILLRP
ncbi:hypothetical protein [Paracoccus rhizosphaerae]|uniref:Uncharacterized protein n=1 Tax=Paracoccus rhizosphaerae TaxID=1133347 RepID=A0ABV6CN04_9RHOB|nr:hypothetical protein [Paracoccus rhizosphaerae]